MLRGNSPYSSPRNLLHRYSRNISSHLYRNSRTCSRSRSINLSSRNTSSPRSNRCRNFSSRLCSSINRSNRSRNISSRNTISRLCSSINHRNSISSRRSNLRKRNRRRKGAYRLP